MHFIFISFCFTNERREVKCYPGGTNITDEVLIISLINWWNTRQNIEYISDNECVLKGANEPQTLDPFIEWLNFMFKYMNIYFKK